VPLDEQPKSGVAAARRRAGGVGRALPRAPRGGHWALEPASAAIFQHIRPAGSDLDELARLGHMTPAAVEEQARAMEDAGYVRTDG
jgi:hypothetical protein